MKGSRAGTILTLIAVMLAASVEVALANHARVPNVKADEAASAATVWVYVENCPFEVAYRTEDGSATAGDDYEAQTGRFRMPSDRPHSQSFQIPLIDDRLKEGDETVRLIVTFSAREVWFGIGAAGCNQGTPTVETIEATLTILDDETPRLTKSSGSGSSTSSNRSISGSTSTDSKSKGSTPSALNPASRSAPVENPGPGLGSEAPGAEVREDAAPLVGTVERRGRAPWSLFFIGMGTIFTVGAVVWRRKRLGGRMT